MESIKLRSHVGSDGLLQIVMPTHLTDTDVEVTIIVQSLDSSTQKKDLSLHNKPTQTHQEISDAFSQLRQSISSDTLSIREMIEEGRRF
jgi:hypothetical protein